ncbi:MAG TPA: heptaprenyl diphosphate synthase, partial [Clostridiales bacterium]|nr:heptaprenyl diphosphate synthase [Clostridiales bacterium]
MWALRKPLGEQKLWVLSAFGAMGHNLGQMAAAVLISRTSAILYYLPVLLVSGIVTGIFTGLCAQLVSKRARQAGLFSK